MDFSCYITVNNNLTQTLKLTNSGNSHGDWDPAPPASIGGKTSPQFRLKDNFGFRGAEGYFNYTAFFSGISEIFQTQFGCPFSADNYVRTAVSYDSICSISYRAKSADGSWYYNSCPPRGHPLYIEYTFDYKTITTAAYVDKLTANGDYTIQNATGQVVNYQQPVWTSSGSYNDGPYSTRPVAFESGTTGVLTVQLQLDAAMNNVPFTLTGKLNNLVILESGTELGTTGVKPVSVSYKLGTSGSRQVYGDVTWVMTIATSGQTITLPKVTRIEFYWLPGRPRLMFTKGVWVTLLRILFPSIPPGALGFTLNTLLANYCFKPAGAQYQKKYDSFNGAAHYGPSWWGGFFNIPKYFGGSTDTANCYDQAGVLQTALGAFGSFSAWAFQYPFGFIKTTDLLGRGPCNNPFFQSNNSPQIVPVNDPSRTMFANHAYLIVGGAVLDACQGPYTGTDDIATYLTDSIDRTTTRYIGLNPPLNRPGTENDIMPQEGVISVETVPPAVDASRFPNVRLVRQALGAAAAPAPADRFFESPRERALEETLANAGLRVTYRREVLGRDGVLVLRSLESAGHTIDMRVWVSSRGGAEALAHLLEDVATIQLPLAQGDVRAVPQLGPLAVSIGPHNGRLLWVHHNVYVSVVADDGRDLLPAAAGINTAIDRSLAADGARGLPTVGAPVAQDEVVRVGEGVEIAFPGEPEWIEYEFGGEGRLEVAAVEGRAFRFKAVAPGPVVVTFMIGNPGTMAVITRSVTVIVNP
jgi:hypothetical protein